MGRAERRRQQRELKQNVATIHKLDAKELKLIAAMVEERVEIEKHRLNKDLIMYCGYALLKNYIDNDTSVNIVEEIANLLKEDNIEKVEKEFFEMGNNKELIMEFFNENKNLSRKELIAEAVYKFPKLAKASIARYYDEWRKANIPVVQEEDDPDVADAMEKISEILDMGKDIESDKVLKEADKVTAEAEKEVSKVNDNIKNSETVAEERDFTPEKAEIIPNAAVIKSNKLKVAEVQLVLTGVENTYKLSKDKLIIESTDGVNSVTNEEEYSKMVDIITSYYNNLLDEIKEAFTTWLTQCKRAV